MSTSPLVVGFLTMARKEVSRVFRIWSQTLLPPVVTTALYFAIFGALIGSQLAPIHGFSYIQFIVPGLVMMAVITSAYSNVVSTFFGAKMQRLPRGALVSPLPDWVIIAGFVSGGVVRALLVAVLVLIVSLLFTHLVIFNVFIIFAAAFLAALLFSLAGLVNGIFAKSFDGITIVPTFVLTPAYIPGRRLLLHRPPAAFLPRALARQSILYMVNAFRYGFLGVSDVNVAASFWVMGGAIVALLILALVLFRRGGLKT